MQTTEKKAQQTLSPSTTATQIVMRRRRRQTYFGNLFHAPRGGTVAQPRQKLLGTAVHERVGKAGQLGKLGGMVLRIPQATHDAIILGDIGTQPPVLGIL